MSTLTEASPSSKDEWSAPTMGICDKKEADELVARRGRSGIDNEMIILGIIL